MAKFNPQPLDTITIGGKKLTFLGYEGAAVSLPMPYKATGKKGTIYQVTDSGQKYALKVFHDSYRVPEIRAINAALADLKGNAGLAVCDRQTILRLHDRQLISQYPELEYAVLMPWIEGDNWENYWQSDGSREIDGNTALNLARQLVATLQTIEELGAAHCDLAGSNIMLEDRAKQAQIIDVEDSFIPGLLPPHNPPAGTSGYQHRTSRENANGQWCPEGDRFAAAILVAEFVSWPVEEIHAAAGGSQARSFFDDTDLEQPIADNPKYQLMLDVLAASSDSMAELFARAWNAKRLCDCPTIGEWDTALKHAQPVDRRCLRKSLDAPELRLEGYSEAKNMRPLLKWNAITGADQYEVEVAETPVFSSVKHRQELVGTQHILSPQKYTKPHFARVRATSGRIHSDWSKPVAISLLPAPKPTLSLLQAGFRLKWAAIKGADGYELDIEGEYPVILFGSSTTKYERSPIDDEDDSVSLLPGKRYVSVKAFTLIAGYGRVSGQPSIRLTLEIRPPKPDWDYRTMDTLARVVQGESNKVIYVSNTRSFTANWTSVAGIDSYQVRIVSLETNRRIVRKSKKTDLEFPLVSDYYELTVVSCTSDGVQSERSEPIIVRATSYDAPSISVRPNTVNAQIGVAWGQVHGATKYELVFEDKEHKPLDWQFHDGSATTLRYALLASEACFARVRALGRFAEPLSDFSEPALLPPLTPNWNAAPVVVGVHIELSWGRLPFVEGYTIFCEAADSGNVFEITKPASSEKATISVERSGDYWLSIASHRNGQQSPLSQRLQVKVNRPPVPKWITLNADGANLTAKWEDLGPDYQYLFQYSDSTSWQWVSNTIVSSALDLTLPPDKYSFRIAAVRGDEVGPLSTERQVKVGICSTKIAEPTQCVAGSPISISWEAIPYATEYRLLYQAVDPDNRRVGEQREIVSATNSVLLSNSLEPGDYELVVQGIVGAVLGPKSPPHLLQVRFLHSPPVFMSERISVAVDDSCQLKWAPVHGVEVYQCEWGYDSSFREIVDRDEGKENYAEVDTSMPQEVYYRIRAIGPYSTSDWTTATIVVGLRTPRILECIASGKGIFIEWASTPGADKYDLCFSDGKRETLLTADDQLSWCGTCHGTAAAVRARSSIYAQESEWSDWVLLPFSGQPLPAPNGLRVTRDRGGPVLVWSTVYPFRSPEFVLEFSGNERFETIHSSFVASGTSYVLGKNELGGFVRIAALREGIRGNWSAPLPLVEIPRPPQQVKLRSDDHGLSVEWSSDSADEYEVLWSTQTDFADSRSVFVHTRHCSFAVPSGEIYVRVRALRQGVPGTWSRAIKKKVKRRPLHEPKVISCNPLNCEAGYDAEAEYVLVWSEVPGSIEYLVQRASDSSIPDADVLYRGSDATASIRLRQGKNTLWVTASDGAISSMSPPFSIEVVPQLPVPMLEAKAFPTCFELRWTPINGATHYEIQILRLNDQKRYQLERTTDEARGVRLSATPGTYACRIRALDRSGSLAASRHSVVYLTLKGTRE